VTPPEPDPLASLLALEQIGIKLGLDQIRALLDLLGRPDLDYPSLIVAGTNGKGSVTAMLEQGLRRAGYRTGRFTSPHLVSLHERFAINGQPIAPHAFDRAARRVLDAGRTLPAPPSFFEATTALALDAFRDASVEVAVLEVGLGGRLDATNAVRAIAAAITSVDFDHEAYLGHTLEAIAGEKAGVIKPGSLAVLAANPPAVVNVVTSRCQEVGATLVCADDGVSVTARMVDGHAHLSLTTPVRTYETLRLALAGRHQVDNAVCAVRLLEELASRGFTLPSEAIRAAVTETVWPARLEQIRVASVDVLLDGAHNPAGARALATHVLDTFGRPLPMVVGVMQDKDMEEILAALAPAASHFVFTAAATPRAAQPAALAAGAARAAPHVTLSVAASPIAAIRQAHAHGSPVVVAGSLFLAGDVRAMRS
jgi:dihydrofolate synthase / folylpolyglutamate synthase